jgi:predicted RNase H-like HicB family nuclease
MTEREIQKLDDALLKKFWGKFPDSFGTLTARITVEEAHKIMEKALETGIEPDRSLWNYDPDPNSFY